MSSSRPRLWSPRSLSIKAGLESETRDFKVPSLKQHFEPGIGYDALTNNLPDLVWESDKNLTYTFVNARSRDLLDYEPSEMIGRSMFDFLAPNEVRRFSDLMASLSTARASFHLLEKTVLRKDAHPWSSSPAVRHETPPRCLAGLSGHRP